MQNGQNGTRGSRSRSGRTALVIGVVAVVAALVVWHVAAPDGVIGEVPYLGVIVGAAVVAVAGAARRRGPLWVAWAWVAAGVALSALGDASWSAYVHAKGFEPDISVADVPWLLSYAAIAVGLFKMLRARSSGHRRDIDGLLDMAVVGVLSLLLVWLLVVQETLNDTSSAIEARLVWAAYPIFDAVLLALVVRTATNRATRSAATFLLAGGIACWLVADFAYMIDPYTPWWPWLDAGWMVGAALMAAAIWVPVPAIRSDTEQSERRWAEPARLALAIAPLLVPMLIEIVTYRSGTDPDPIPLFLATLALCGLLFVRTMRLLQNRRRAEAEVLATKQHFEALVQRSADAAFVLDPDGTIRYVSAAAIDQFGYTADELVGRVGWEMIHPDDVERSIAAFSGLTDRAGAHATVEIRIRDGNGQWRWIEEVVTNLLDEPAVGGLVANIRDISDRKAAEQKLSRQARYDELTRLPNRFQVTELLEDLLGSGRDAALLVFDLDQFRFVNTSRGRATGDRLLQNVAERTRSVLPDDDTVGRLGGDVFAVVCPDVGQWLVVAERARLVQRTLGHTFDLTGHGHFHVSAAVGMTLAEEGQSATELVQQAETAMHAAKAQGPGSIAAFDERLRDEVDERLTIEHDLHRALRAGELVVHYQPVVDVATGAIDGVEALVRWRHPTRGLLLPGEFVPIAEESSLIDRIGEFVLHQACEDAAWWARSGVPLSVAVNVSAAQLCHERLPDTVGTVLYESGLEARQLVIEVTETALLTGADRAMANLETLRRLGVQVALDDFGTGYSSLAYLKNVPADIVKVDRSFVKGVTDSQADRDIVAAIVDLSRALGRNVVAEGVEVPEQLAELRRLHCPLAQGFLWSPAVPAEEVLRLIDPMRRTSSISS